MTLDAIWYSAGLNDVLWGKAGTYKRIPAEALPPIAGPFDGTFNWLTSPTPISPYGMSFGYDEDDPQDPPIEQLEKREAEAKRAGLVVPAEFIKFMSTLELAALIPTCTSCYFDLGARLVPLPSSQGPERLLRFMNDQQSCFVWCLLLEPGRQHRVVVATPLIKEGSTGESFEDVAELEDVRICAASFEEFLKRFWIENTLWFANNAGSKVAPELAAYSEAARRSVASGLVPKD